jgi:hypothetical protein
MSATLAPRVEVYTTLVCAVHRPDILKQSFPDVALGHHARSHDPIEITFPKSQHLNIKSLSKANRNSPNHRNLCAADPVVQAATAKFIAGQILGFYLANLV